MVGYYSIFNCICTSNFDDIPHQNDMFRLQTYYFEFWLDCIVTAISKFKENVLLQF